MVLFYIALFHVTVNRQIVRTGAKSPEQLPGISGSLRIIVWHLAVCATRTDSVLNRSV